jgi:hypothetical protein
LSCQDERVGRAKLFKPGKKGYVQQRRTYRRCPIEFADHSEYAKFNESIIIERKQKRPIVDFKTGNEEWDLIAPKSRWTKWRVSQESGQTVLFVG